MALKIRLRRMGRKKAPTYRIVVAESTMPRDGRFVANLGHYNPRSEPLVLVVNREQALYWLERGAVPTDTARSLLKKAGVFGPEEPGAVESAVEAVKGTAQKAAKAVAAAAATVVDAAQEAVAEVREAVGGEEPAAAPEAAAPEAAGEEEAKAE